MKKKYIIELEDRNVWSCGLPAKTLLLSDVSIFGTDLSSVNTGIELTPYTEPDTSEAYQRGAEDMREALRLLIDCDDECLTNPDIFKAFGEGSYHAVVRKHPAMEIIEKIRQYEQEQKQEEEQIQVGDEVKGGDERYVVLQKYLNNIDELMVVLLNRRNGEIDKWHLYNANGVIFEKTGKHFPEIIEVLQRMKKEG